MYLRSKVPQPPTLTQALVGLAGILSQVKLSNLVPWFLSNLEWEIEAGSGLAGGVLADPQSAVTFSQKRVKVKPLLELITMTQQGKCTEPHRTHLPWEVPRPHSMSNKTEEMLKGIKKKKKIYIFNTKR